MVTLFQDLKYAARLLAKNPGFAFMAILALALGVGANTAIFSVVNSVLLRPLAYAHPDRLVVVLHEGTFPVSPADFIDWRNLSRSFEQMAAAQAWGGTLTGTDRPEVVQGMQLTANMFSLLGVPPLLGRTFRTGEDQPGSNHVMVLSYAFWNRRFGRDPKAIGRQLVLNGESYSVIGVMPEQFHFAPFWNTDRELWVPLDLSRRLDDRGGRSLRVFARLRPGVTVDEAQAESDMICRQLERLYPKTNTNMAARVAPLQEKVVANIRPMLLVLLTTVGFVLLIACANVANLMLVRANGKQRETAVRLAIGSSRWRLIRQTLVESLLLSLAGATAGLAIARWGIPALVASLPPGSLPRLEEVAVDRTVFGFTLLLAIATGMVCGLAPALRAMRADLNDALKSGGRGSTEGRSHRRVRGALVMAEVALAIMLMIGSGLMLRSFGNLQSVDPGFDPRRVLTMIVNAGGTAYPEGAQRIRFFEQLRAKLEALPGVRSLSFINHLPINGDIWTLGIQAADRPAPPPGRGVGAAYRVVQPGYFETMRIPIRAGRDFNFHDAADSQPVAIVNEHLARQQWPDREPVGKRIALPGGATPKWMTVIGVVRDVKQSDWTAGPGNEIYLPHAQSDAMLTSYMTLVMRTSGDPLAMTHSVEDAAHSIDKDVPASRAESMEHVIGDKLWRGRLTMQLLGVFASVALMLAALGLYGVISYSVSQRTNEIGIRMALGAGRGDVLRVVIRQGLAMVGAGVATGLLGAWALTRAAASLLYGVSPADPLTFVSVPVLLSAVAIAACAAPALRAARVDPTVALRYE